MIMYSLHPTQNFAPILMGAKEATETINQMVTEGVPVHTTDFRGLDGTRVALFWTMDSQGRVATVWEYTFTYWPNVPTTNEVRLVEAREASVMDAEVSGDNDRDAYAVGE